MEAAEAQAIVQDGIQRWATERRARVDGFVDATFSLAGSARLHRAALGWDVLRAPANIALAVPQLAWHGAAAAARGIGRDALARRMHARSLLLRTQVGRELEWRVWTGLLELPMQQEGRSSEIDSLARTILDDPRVTEAAAPLLAAIGEHAGAPATRARLEESLRDYAGTRAAAAEIATGLLTLSTGAIALQKLTPGAATLGPALAGVLAQQAAIAGFPLGAGLGSVWYGMFPAAPALGLTIGLTGGLMLAASAFAAFSGVLTDPVQRGLGLHQRRLRRMIDALERMLLDKGASGFSARDHYAARLLDLLDVLAAAARALR